VAAAVGQLVDAEADEPGSDQILLVTATAGVAITAGPAGGLSAVGARSSSAALPAVAIALSTNCYLIWQQRVGDDKAECRRWLQQALQAVDDELQRVLTSRYAQLRDLIGGIAADAVDHGVLLA
jgi:hypothetical protein